MLRCEIEAKRPEAVVFLTGWWWARPFVESFKTKDLIIQPNLALQAHGRFIADNHEAAFAVVPHPQAKPTQQVASAVLSGIQKA